MESAKMHFSPPQKFRNTMERRTVKAFSLPAHFLEYMIFINDFFLKKQNDIKKDHPLPFLFIAAFQ